MTDMPSEEVSVKRETDEDNARDVRKMTWPDIIAAMRDGEQEARMRLLPPPVRRRISALKKLQYEMTGIEAEFFAEVHELECRYNEKYIPYFTKRDAIVNGSYEPSDDDCLYPTSQSIEELDRKYEQTAPTDPSDQKGVPDFWLTVFKNIAMMAEMIQPNDEAILRYLKDVRVTFNPSSHMGFMLSFFFMPNEYFSNEVLTKEYFMKCMRDESDPFGFEGPEIYKSRGTVINWYKDKNITVKTVKKRQKHKGRGSLRTVTRVVPTASFFNFFNPPDAGDEGGIDLDEETQAVLSTDFELGHYLRERVIPRAVLYFTGEALEDEEEEEEDDEEADEDEDETKGERDEDEELEEECGDNENEDEPSAL